MPAKRVERSPQDLVGKEGQPDSQLARPPIFSDQPWDFVDHDVANRKAPKEAITALARKHTMEAVLTLVYHMRNSRDPEVSMKAAELLIERGWGKAPQVVGVVDGSAGADTSGMKLALAEKIAILEAAAEGKSVPLSVSPTDVFELPPAEAAMLD